MSLDRWEAELAAILRAPDPVRARDVAVAAVYLPADVRGWLTALDPDGLRISARIVARIRAERLMDGDADAARWFATDPASFVAAFDRYHREVAPRAWMPAEEAEAWRRWREGPTQGR